MLLHGSLRSEVERRLRDFPVRTLDAGTHRTAAVVVALAEEGEGADIPGLARPAGWSPAAALLLTRRAEALSSHSGQWALPGGRIDEGESPQEAALRELHEELGLRLDAADVLGRLDDYATRSGFVITPVVVWAGAARGLVPNPAEVASVHRVRLAEFMRPDAPLLEPSDEPGRQILRLPLGSGWIAAPTAAVIYQFREVGLAGRDTRVAHFDQPLFARR
ncbi:CoA pyrophosphatase [Ramlibacter tataouinensis]|uniref:NUDIX hydrolase n=1 Tax=Ramlibacter tataouinensis TaxID=94132 RepID=UPI0022F3B162|nr:CoA pyrophosphatase [Ramlibacter tataouinensis]WBY02438.1 CoA pyrophosphatase [Ramlibacter tataouinensis]